MIVTIYSRASFFSEKKTLSIKKSQDVLVADCGQVDVKMRQKINSRRTKRYAVGWIDQIFGRNPSSLTQQNIAIGENGDKSELSEVRNPRTNWTEKGQT